MITINQNQQIIMTIKNLPLILRFNIIISHCYLNCHHLIVILLKIYSKNVLNVLIFL